MLIRPADILLPDLSDVSCWTKWAVVACDQYTSEPEYWERVRRFTDGAPSTLDLILPEAYLADPGERVDRIHRKMAEYMSSGLFREYPDCGIYLERTLRSGKTRRGIVAAVDLEEYDYRPGSDSVIRATEATVVERIPPRLKIREGAPLELPHIMLLVDDPDDALIGRFRGRRLDAYSFPLMENSGSVSASFIEGREFDGIESTLAELGRRSGSGIVLAVGDGNHSLATAKTAYENIKKKTGSEAAASHPARYALCEIVNLYDPSLEFEPIFRLVTGTDPSELLSEFAAYSDSLNGSRPAQRFTVVLDGGTAVLTVPAPEAELPVTTLQKFLDAYAAAHPGTTLDYIHGEESLIRLSEREGCAGFLFEGMKKEDLFPSVASDGCLPRKTFSMGEASDKRFYIEARKIL